MNNIKINSNDWELEIDLNGGRIVELKKNKKVVLGSFQRIDGKIGNTHVCSPNFAGEGMEKFGFIFHGPFRNSQWILINKTDDNLEIECEIEELKIIQRFILRENFSQEIEVKNTGEEQKRLNMGIHNYFATEFGWQGIKINEIEMSEIVKVSDYVELKNINKIEIPGKENIIWKTDGFKFAKLWTAFKEENGEKVFDKDYVCIEPVRDKEGFVETEESFINCGEKLAFKQEIGVVYRT